jgi:LacI family repressor for deo operon, udp, cdd, tsx, nupC, and nupG
MTTPPLTTVRLPLHEIGRKGAAFAEALVAGDTPTPEILPTELIERGSTGPVPATALPAAVVPA